MLLLQLSLPFTLFLTYHYFTLAAFNSKHDGAKEGSKPLRFAFLFLTLFIVSFLTIFFS